MFRGGQSDFGGFWTGGMKPEKRVDVAMRGRVLLAFRVRVTGESMVGSPARSIDDLKAIILELAERAGMQLFQCAIGRAFLPVYSANGNPTAAVEAIVFDPAGYSMEDGFDLNRLPVAEARYVDGGWRFVITGERQLEAACDPSVVETTAGSG